MKRGTLSVIFAALLSALSATLVCTTALLAAPPPVVGQVTEVTARYSVTLGITPGLSDTSGKDQTLVERVVAIRAGGVELEYDLPDSAPTDERLRAWMYPVRVLKPTRGAMKLLNRLELEGRLDARIKALGLTRKGVCAQSSAAHLLEIECDTRNVIKELDVYQLEAPDLSKEATYRERLARRPSRWIVTPTQDGGVTYTANLDLDPDLLRRAQAGEAGTRYSGTISLQIDTDPERRVRRRTWVMKVVSEGESATTTTLRDVEERKPLPAEGGR